MKLIMENWRKFINESESGPESDGNTSKPSIPDPNNPEAVLDIDSPEAREVLNQAQLGLIRVDFFTGAHYRIINRKPDGTIESLAELSDSREDALRRRLADERRGRGQAGDNSQTDPADTHVYYRAKEAETTYVHGQAILYNVPQGPYDLGVILHEEMQEYKEFMYHNPQGVKLPEGDFELGEDTMYFTIDTNTQSRVRDALRFDSDGVPHNYNPEAEEARSQEEE